MITLPIIVEGTVAVLLAATLGCCVLLERRLRGFRADQEALRALIPELAVSTARAEEAVRGLGATTRQAETALEGRIGEAKALAHQLAFIVRDGARPRQDRPQPGRARAR
jgi:hypothetical protein